MMSDDPGDIAIAVSKKLSQAAVGQIPGFGPLASPIIDQVFSSIFGGGSSPASWVGEILRRVQQIVRQELVTDTLSHINGGLHNISQAMYDEYSPAKKRLDLSRNVDRQQLFGLLQKYDSAYISGTDGMLSTLEQHPIEGFTLYLAGVSLRLMIYQEMAVTDPTFASPADWPKTPYGAQDGTIARFADSCANTAQAAWNAIVTQRRAPVDFYWIDQGMVHGSPWDRWGYYFLVDPLSRSNQRVLAQDAVPPSDPYRDEVASHNARQPERGDDTDFWNAAKARIPNEYFDGLAYPDLTTEFSNPLTTIANWRALVLTPLPAGH